MSDNRGSGAIGVVFAIALVMLIAGALFGVSRALGGTTVINNDQGGLIRERADEIAQMQADGERVEIRGWFCYSSCTMYLSLDDLCVTPRTRFGFHGPSYYGKPLSPDRFAYWANVMANHYPEPIRSWFLSTVIVKKATTVLMGSELIRVGFEAC